MARFGTAIAHDGAQTVVSAPPQMTKYGVEGGTISVFIRRPGAPWRANANAVIAPEEAEASDLFGSAIASGPGLVVSGIPNANTPLAVDAGRVLVFQQNVATRLWLESAPIESPAPEVGSNFGKSVAVLGELVLAGQPSASRAGGSGTVFAFQKRSASAQADETTIEQLDEIALRSRLGKGVRRGTAWRAIEEWAAPTIAPTRSFGQTIASSKAWVAVGAPGSKEQPGHVVLFRASAPASPPMRGKPAEPRPVTPAPAAETPVESRETAPATPVEPPFEEPPAYPGSSL